MASPKHGTPARYNKHWRDGEPACEPCLRAWRERTREYQRKRRKNPEALVKDKKHNLAQSRALWRLAHRFPGLFKRYLKEELEK